MYLTSKSLGDLYNALRTPGAFGVDDGDAAFGTALLFRQLGDHSHGVRELCLAATWGSSVNHPTEDHGETHGTRRRLH